MIGNLRCESTDQFVKLSPKRFSTNDGCVSGQLLNPRDNELSDTSSIAESRIHMSASNYNETNKRRVKFAIMLRITRASRIQCANCLRSDKQQAAPAVHDKGTGGPLD